MKHSPWNSFVLAPNCFSYKNGLTIVIVLGCTHSIWVTQCCVINTLNFSTKFATCRDSFIQPYVWILWIWRVVFLRSYWCIESVFIAEIEKNFIESMTSIYPVLSASVFNFLIWCHGHCNGLCIFGWSKMVIFDLQNLILLSIGKKIICNADVNKIPFEAGKNYTVTVINIIHQSVATYLNRIDRQCYCERPVTAVAM